MHQIASLLFCAAGAAAHAANGVVFPPTPSTPAKMGVNGTDYYHFTLNNYATRDQVATGVYLTKWTGDPLGQLDLSLGVPAHNLISWDKDSTTQYPASTAWFRFDTTYYIVSGNVSLTVNGNDSLTLTQGDTLWVRAGTPHTPLTPTAGGAMIDALVIPYNPQLTPPPAMPSDTKAKGDLSYRAYYKRGVQRNPTQGIDHYQWYSEHLSDPAVLHVWWLPNTTIPLHYHAEGALYVPSVGEICFTGEFPSDCVGPGEARWTRPGYSYSDEGTKDSGCEIIVLNTESGPNMMDAAGVTGDFLSTHHISLNYVAHGTAPYNSSLQ